MAENARTWCAMEADFKAILVHNKVSDDCVQNYVQQFDATTAKRRCTVYIGIIFGTYLSHFRRFLVTHSFVIYHFSAQMLSSFCADARRLLLGNCFDRWAISDILTDMENHVVQNWHNWVIIDSNLRIPVDDAYRLMVEYLSWQCGNELAITNMITHVACNELHRE